MCGYWVVQCIYFYTFTMINVHTIYTTAPAGWLYQLLLILNICLRSAHCTYQNYNILLIIIYLQTNNKEYKIF